MGKITCIKREQGRNQDRVYVYIDNNYCISIRERTFEAFNLSVGDDANCKELKEREAFFWKKEYGQQAWKQEQYRLNRIQKWFEKYMEGLSLEVTGFGAGTTEEILEHPDESGKPDITISITGTDIVIMMLEVTGTKTMRGSGYWVRPDKLEYAKKHPEENVWIALHYTDPQEKIIWIKPNLDKQYEFETINIRQADEHFVVFKEGDDEVVSSKLFQKHLMSIIQELHPTR